MKSMAQEFVDKHCLDGDFPDELEDAALCECESFAYFTDRSEYHFADGSVVVNDTTKLSVVDCCDDGIKTSKFYAIKNDNGMLFNGFQEHVGEFLQTIRVPEFEDTNPKNIAIMSKEECQQTRMELAKLGYKTIMVTVTIGD